ncbi:MAG: CapA family protein [Myxococcales bacterium]|nr:CapA family protein [Myxococcales bacterium]
MLRPLAGALAGLVTVSLFAVGGCGFSHDGYADSRTEPPPTPKASPPEPVAAAPIDAAEEDEERERAPAEDAPRARPSEDLEITFVGDIIFGRFREGGYDPIPGPDDQPFAEIKALMAADIVVGNLETPMARTLPDDSPIGATFRFGAAAENAKHLVDGGLTALSLANNHAFDLRAMGMRETPQILAEKGLVALGAAREEDPLFRVETIERKGWRVAFIAVTTRRNAPDFEGAPRVPFTAARDLEANLGELIDGARQTHDAIFVVIHWGDEYADAPAKVQERAARRLIERGVTGVIGHHPHVLQGIERHRHGVIAYSLGNFLFENTNEIPRQTGVLRLHLDADQGCVDELRFHPAYVKRIPSPHPVPATKGMGKVVRGRMETLSRDLKTKLERDGEDLVLRGFECPPVIPEVAAPSELGEGEGEGEGAGADAGDEA